MTADKWAAPTDRVLKENAAVLRQCADRIDFQKARIAELEAALQEARLQLEYLSEKFGQTGTGNATLAKINAALAKTHDTGAELPDPPWNVLP